jgi:hypothetical protein
MPQGYTLAYRHHYSHGMVQGQALSFGSVYRPFYSILDQLDDLRAEPTFDFMLQWHGSLLCTQHCTSASTVARQRWRQKSSPVTSRAVEGYSAIDTPFTHKGQT